MTTEDLLRPRYKITSLWPTCMFDVGDILYKYEYPTGGGLYCYVTNIIQPLMGLSAISEHVESFPHLFEPLPWWKDRKVEDMPEYVKVINEVCAKDTGLYCRVFKWSIIDTTKE